MRIIVRLVTSVSMFKGLGFHETLGLKRRYWVMCSHGGLGDSEE
jgi:hypothetical protein